MKRLLFILFVEISTLVAFGAELPNDIEIDMYYSPTSTPTVFLDNVTSLITNIKYSASSFASNELRRVQYHLMSNAIDCVVWTNGNWCEEFDSRVSLIGAIFSFSNVKHERDAYDFCLRYLGTLIPCVVDENIYRNELAAAIESDSGSLGEHYIACRKKWNSHREYNHFLNSYRSRLAMRLSRATAEQYVRASENERQTFLSEISSIGGLSTNELQLITRRISQIE